MEWVSLEAQWFKKKRKRKEKNVLPSAGDTGSILDPGRFHMLQNNQAHAQLLTLCSGACVPQLLKPTYPRACALK